MGLKSQEALSHELPLPTGTSYQTFRENESGILEEGPYLPLSLASRICVHVLRLSSNVPLSIFAPNLS